VKDAWIIRRVEPGDGEALAAFALRLWPDRDPGAFRRRWWMNSTPAQCFGAFAGDGSVGGVCAARQQEVFVRGVAARAVGICDWFVDPGTRGAGLGRRLVEAALVEHQVAWSLSLSAEAEGAFVKLKFGPYPALRVPLFLAPSPLVAVRHALSLGRGLDVETRSFDHASVDSLADEFEQAGAFGSKVNFTGGARDLEAWRSHLALVPRRSYQAHLLRDRQAGLVAVAVSRRLPRGGFPRLGPTRLTLISELLYQPSHQDRLQLLFRRVAVNALRAGSELLCCPIYDPPAHEVLARAGFFSSEASWRGWRVPRLSTRFMSRQAIAPVTGPLPWRVTALDCDFDLGLGADAEA
jgi:GNAT superfamily N-acetyltransferase